MLEFYVVSRQIGVENNRPVFCPADRVAPRTPSQPVWAENQSAAKLSAMDARWILAARTSQSLEGGRAALLTPDKRRLLVRLGHAMGLRAFDAALVIAIAQDAARAGEPLTRSAQERLAMVRPANTSDRLRRFEVIGLMTAAFFLGGLYFAIIRVWLRV
jgi:hypothetical protein